MGHYGFRLPVWYLQTVVVFERRVRRYPKGNQNSKKNRQNNGKKYKRTNNVLPNTHIRLQIEKHESH
jgi:hypothetical protein